MAQPVRGKKFNESLLGLFSGFIALNLTKVCEIIFSSDIRASKEV
jgi:hypothetical protein